MGQEKGSQIEPGELQPSGQRNASRVAKAGGGGAARERGMLSPMAKVNVWQQAVGDPASGLGYGAHVTYCWRWLALKQREKWEDFLLRRW